MRSFGFLTILLLFLIRFSEAVNHLSGDSTLTCGNSSDFSVSYLLAIIYPENKTIRFDLSAVSKIEGNVTIKAEVIAYGLSIIQGDFDFCLLHYQGLCPFSGGHIDMQLDKKVDQLPTDKIPGVAYTIPNLDASIRVQLVDTSSKSKVYACLEVPLSNGKTVQTEYAAWPIAAVSGLGVLTSGIVSIIGHTNTAAHIASNSMSLFVYFQSLAITSMMGVARVPPIAAAWAQNFQWSLGIIRLGFIQDIANWYVQSTGGSATDILKSSHLMVSVQKRAFKRSLWNYVLKKRDNLNIGQHTSLDSNDYTYSDSMDNSLYSTNEKSSNLNSKILVLRGIQRVAYLAKIEITDLFMTSIIFLLFFAFVVVVCISAFKAVVEILVRSKIMNEGRFGEYRQQWAHIIKGSLYRILLLALPYLSVMCLWQFAEHDSVGTVIVAVFLLAIVLILLFQAAIRVILLGRRSVRQFRNAAYLLYGDGKFLNKFGFIYSNYNADCYYFVLITMIYLFIKSLFVALMQKHGKPQSVIIFVIELAYFITLCVKRPFMDRITNSFNITISVINTINAFFFMFFSYVFKQPHIVASVMAIVYFVLNAAFALFLLLFTIITCILALLYKNPDTRYQPMKDDRVSFLPRFDRKKKGLNDPSNGDLELLELGATAMRGHENGGKPLKLYDDDSYELDSIDESRQSGLASHSYNELPGEIVEPTQPSSTLVGNIHNAMGGYHVPYGAAPNPENRRNKARFAE